MIDPDYVQTMARYNAWQNRQITTVLKVVPEDTLRADQGAFFGSIMATLNHLLWGDTMWMSRFSDTVPAPIISGADSVEMTPTFGVWSAERFRMDGAIRMWADALKSVDLCGPLSWHSGVLGREIENSIELCVTHMFNHQTHHRGQVHAMMTAAGLEAPVTDMIFMPEEG